MTVTETELLPCPFCGKPPAYGGSGERQRGLMIECVTGGCVNPHVSYYEHATAIEKWNTRALTAALSGQVVVPADVYVDLLKAVTDEVNEKGAGGYLLARLSDARKYAPPLPPEVQSE